MAKRPRSEKQFIAAEKFAVETATLAKRLVSLRARLKKLKNLRDKNVILTSFEEALGRRLVNDIASTKKTLAKRGVAITMMNNNEALKGALLKAREKRAVVAPKSGGVGIYGMGQGKKVW